MIESYKTKLIVFGEYFETYHYSKPQITGVAKPKKKKATPMDDSQEPKKKFAYSMNRTRNTVRRLISANFSNKSDFLTLTFADNIQDLDYANKCFKAFIRALRNEIYYHHHDKFPVENFKYLAVIEFQKRGAIHYHVLMNCPFLGWDTWYKYWDHGWLKINKVKHVNDIGLYVSKYMRKDSCDIRLRGKRSYQTSRNLIRPYEVIDKNFVRGFLSNVGKKKKLLYTNTFDNEYTGKVHYRLLRRDE